MSGMNVTVVIPALNEEDSIGGTLDAVTQQLSFGDEVLVLDNGSTDRTAEIAVSFDHVRVISVPDKTLAQVRQHGAESARNPIVATTDADTLPGEHWVDRIKYHFESDPELAVVWGVAVDKNGVPARNVMGKWLTLIGGMSGCNTAFRRSEFMRLKKGYLDPPYVVFHGFEDFTLITRLARVGKARRDESLKVITDLPRKKYQTIPLVAAGIGIGAFGLLLPSPYREAVTLGGVGLAGTELIYEGVAQNVKTPIHHDQVGAAGVIAGAVVGGAPGAAIAGASAGVIGHHVVTEGISGFENKLMKQTDEVCNTKLVSENGKKVLVTECEPKDEIASVVSRLILVSGAGAAAFTAAGYLID